MLNDDQIATIAGRFVAELHTVTPEWTEPNDPDPGVTLIQLFAFLTEQLLYRTTQPQTERFQHVIARAALALGTLRDQDVPTVEGLARVNYFYGKILSLDDLRTEQDYFIARRRLHNHALLGEGVVSGLTVEADGSSAADSPGVTIGPGCAIDANGEDMILTRRWSGTLRAAGVCGFVTLRYVERLTADAASVIDGDRQPTRIREGIAIEFVENPQPNAVAIARLEHRQGVWRVDPAYQPPRCRRRD